MNSNVGRMALILAFALPASLSLAQEAHPPAASELELSPAVTELLRSEMREIAVGVQQIAASIPVAGWAVVHDTALRIRDSYIMNRELTGPQRQELEQVLPARFEELDQELHGRAESLARAAEQRDAEQVVFHFARMLEACTNCHARYAAARFPEFTPAEEPQPHHH